MDVVTGNIFLPLGALGLALYVGWIYKNPIEEIATGAGPGVRRWLGGWLWLLRILAPAFLIVILAMGFGSIKDAVARALRRLTGPKRNAPDEQNDPGPEAAVRGRFAVRCRGVGR